MAFLKTQRTEKCQNKREQSSERFYYHMDASVIRGVWSINERNSKNWTQRASNEIHAKEGTNKILK